MTNVEPDGWLYHKPGGTPLVGGNAEGKPMEHRFAVEPLYTLEKANAILAKSSTLADAVRGISHDYMTSENHHPDYVLIPLDKFTAICAAAGEHIGFLSTGESDADKAAEHDFWGTGA